MKSSLRCPLADHAFTRKAVLRVAVNIELPVRVGQPHFFLKIDHTLRWRHGIGVTVQHEDFGYDRVPLRGYRRTQNPVEENLRRVAGPRPASRGERPSRRYSIQWPRCDPHCIQAALEGLLDRP